MKYTAKSSLEIKMSEFYMYTIPKCSKGEIKKYVKNTFDQAVKTII